MQWIDTAPMREKDRELAAQAHDNGLACYVMVEGAPAIGRNGCVLHYVCTGVRVLRSRKNGKLVAAVAK